MDILPGQRERFGQALDKPLRKRRGIRRVDHIRFEDGEFVAAKTRGTEARQRVTFAQRCAETFGHHLQEQIAVLMPESVVDVLEMVDVEIENGEKLSRISCARKGALQTLNKGGAIEKAGETVVICEMDNAFFRILSLGDIGHDTFQSHEAAGSVADRIHKVRNPRSGIVATLAASHSTDGVSLSRP